MLETLSSETNITYSSYFYTLNYDKTIYEHRRIPLTIKTNMVDLGDYILQLRKDRTELMKKDQYDYSEILDKIESSIEFILNNDIQFFYLIYIKK